jgi:Xaa-Pro aminopeptidase
MEPSKEILINLERLQLKMDEYGMDAVVARAGINYTYLSGIAYPGTLARHLDLTDSPRGTYLIWPRRGEPKIVLNAIAEELTRRDSWVNSFEVYEGYVEQPAERVAKAIVNMGLSSATVGFERNFISAGDWDTLRSRLPSTRMVDCTLMMDEVRAIKTPGEIALLRRGADILDGAYAKVFKQIRPGFRERDVHAAIVSECIVNGCEFVHGILNSHRNPIPYAGESDFIFAAGDAVRTDYVSYLKGYPGHQSRCAVIGAPSDEQLRQYRVVHDIYRASIDQCRVGNTAGQLYGFVVDRFAQAGMEYKSMLAGHSVGCWWHQQEPVISRGNSRALEEGMVIAMEPHVNHWHIQDMVLISQDGPEIVSKGFSTEAPFACA